jgi:transposase
MTNEILLSALEKELQRKRMMRDVGVADAETRVNLQKNFLKELKRLEGDLVEKVDKISYSLNDTEAQIFVRKFVLGMNSCDIMNELHISSSNYYRFIALIEEKIKDNKDFEKITETLKIEQ